MVAADLKNAGMVGFLLDKGANIEAADKVTLDFEYIWVDASIFLLAGKASIDIYYGISMLQLYNIE